MDFQLGKKLFDALYGNINGYTISAKARSTIPHPDRAFTYGEVAPESFYEILLNVTPQKGEVFYDLGSGTGKAVILASLFFEFSKCIGIETLEGLYEASKEILIRFNHESSLILGANNKVTDFILSDFLEYDFSDGDIFFVHSTCFQDELMDQLSKKLECLKKGARVITVTKTITSSAFQEIQHKDTNMSWGKATVYYYKRI